MGIYDRDYMRNRQRPDNMNGRQALITLIVINAVCYFLIDRNTPFYNELALSTGLSIKAVWQIFTAAFLHADFSHAFFNMWGLYIFGSLVAPHVSGRKFIILYLAGAATGNLLFLLFNLMPMGPIQLVGASGAVCAVMAAAATLEPNRRFVMLFLPFAPLKTTTLVICYTILELLLSFNTSSHIAHLAHLGGFIGGYAAMKIWFGKRLPWDPLRKLFNAATPGFNPPPRQTTARPDSDSRAANSNKERISQRELDALLDKLSTSGINSLSEYELERLRKARRQMRGEDD